MIDVHPWALESFESIKHDAQQGDGYSAAFLYALTSEEKYLSAAKNWLFKIAEQGGDLGARAMQVDADFFSQGMPWLGDVYYRLDTRPLKAFDYIYSRLTPSERDFVETGLTASANFRKNAMDTWWQTPNLVFKPTSMVAIHGLLTQNPEHINWGFFRNSESGLGGYFPTLNNMLKDNGPWDEAPVYAISHRPLSMSLEISDYLNRMTHKDWYNRKLPGGSSVRGLMQYYINTTYPPETRPNGSRVYRLLTYGDGATGQRGDTYLFSENPHQRNLKNELAQAYRISRDPDYAALLKLDKNYRADLLQYPQLPDSPLMPKAPSSLWKDFGLAFLRSNNSRSYWNNSDTMAASLLFRQGYGHGHSDAMSITLFAAGQLFYPDYNAVQYENPAIGWTSSSIAHNTVIVDGMNSSIPKTVSDFHQFQKDFNIVQARVNEVPGITKIRTLVLTPHYLLDIFHVNSLITRTYDYLLHSFARIRPNNENAYEQAAPFDPRYSRIKDFRSLTTDTVWSVTYIMDLEQVMKRAASLVSQFTDSHSERSSVEKAFGVDNTDTFKTSALGMTMAAQAGTQIGIGEDEYGLSFLAARRAGQKHTTFVTTHRPVNDTDKKSGNTVETLIDNRDGTIVKVVGESSIELHAVAHGPGQIRLADESTGIFLEFENYAYLRIDKMTTEVKTRGKLRRFFVAPEVSSLQNDISLGSVSAGEFDMHPPDMAKIQVNTYPKLVVLKDYENTSFTLSVTNLTDEIVNASAILSGNEALDIPQPVIPLESIPAYQTYSTKVNLGRYTRAAGIDALSIEVRLDDTGQIVNHGLLVSAGPGLIESYEDIENPSYRIHTFNSSVDISMREGSITQIGDRHDRVLYSGQPLFTVSDDRTSASHTRQALINSYTWPNREQASVITEINNRIRWHMLTIQNRFYLKLDEVYTRAETVMFDFDKNNSAIDWDRSRYLDGDEIHSPNLTTRSMLSARGFELPLTGTGKSICINNLAAGQWLNTTAHLRLFIKRGKNQQWSFGVCDTGSLAQWMNHPA